MTPSTTSVLFLVLSYSLTAIASPISAESNILRKRSPSPHNIGIGFAIAISILIFASFVFYLGVLRGRTGSWLFWRDPVPSFRPFPVTEKVPIIDTDDLKSRIGSPIPMHSSALPELSPVEAQPRFAELCPMETEKNVLELSASEKKVLELSASEKKVLELSASDKSVYEMGQPSLRRPSSTLSTAGKTFYSSRKSSIATVCRKSVASVKTTGKNVYSTSEKPPKVESSWFDRKSWFCQGAMEVEDEEKRIRGKDSAEDLDGNIPEPPPPTAVVEWREGEHRGTMDWSGMEWLTKMYNERKSRRMSGMRSFYIPGGDEK